MPEKKTVSEEDEAIKKLQEIAEGEPDGNNRESWGRELTHSIVEKVEKVRRPSAGDYNDRDDYFRAND